MNIKVIYLKGKENALVNVVSKQLLNFENIARARVYKAREIALDIACSSLRAGEFVCNKKLIQIYRMQAFLVIISIFSVGKLKLAFKAML